MNPAVPNLPPPLPKQRPVLVWVIFIFYAFSVVSTLFSYAVVFSGLVPKTAAQQQYFSALTPIDHALTALVITCNVTAAVLLFRLKKQAPAFFALAMAIALVTLIYQCVAKNWLSAVGVAGLIGTAIGWGINIAILIYTLRLRKHRILT